MERRALVIKTYGDPEIAGALLDGMTREAIPLNSAELQAMRKELTRLQAREGTRRYREQKDWVKTCAELERKYGTKRHSDFYGNLLLVYAMAALAVKSGLDRLLWELRRRTL